MTETKPESRGFGAVEVKGATSVTSTETKLVEVKQSEIAKPPVPEMKPVKPSVFDFIKEKISKVDKNSSTFFKNSASFIVVIMIILLGWHYRARIVTHLDNSEMSQIGMLDNGTTTNTDTNSASLPTDLATSATGSVKFGWQIGQAYLGVHYVNINAIMQKNAKLPVAYGALIQAGQTQNDVAVVSGSPADKAGIVAGDIILEADNMKLDENTTTLGTVIAQKATGEVITLKILHEGVEKIIQLTLGIAKENSK